jgi:tetratricopeptide (TPR) repeat protein
MNYFRKAPLLLASLCLLPGLFALGCDSNGSSDDSRQVEPPAAEASQATEDTSVPTPTAELTGDAGALVERLDAQIRLFGERAESPAGSWVDHDRVAQAHLTRARLTSDWNDYRNAEQAVQRAFDAAPDGAGPLVTRIRLNATLHRFDRVEADLDLLEARPETDKSRASLASVRAELALQQGRADDAIKGLEAVHQNQPTAATACRLAHLYAKTGRNERAEPLYAEVSELAKGAEKLTRSWVALQRGIHDLERGRLDDALTHFETADQIMSGWYLVEEHIAEVLASTGKSDRAIAMYRSITDRVPNGEFYDALADTLEDDGQTERAAEARRKARRAYEEDLKIFPEVAYGHAVGHFLLHGSADKAVELARANFELRPTPESQVRLIQALVRADRVETAATEVEKLLESPWQTAELHATVARVFEMRGEAARADKHRRLANQMHPGVVQEFEWLVASTED